MENTSIDSLDVKGLDRLAPNDYGAILKDLEVLVPGMRHFKIKIGDTRFMHNKGHLYVNIQSILVDLERLKEPLDQDVLTKTLECNALSQWQNAGLAEAITASQPVLLKCMHAVLGKLISELSPNAQECLRAGVSFEDVDDAWNTKLANMNNAYLLH